MVVVVAVAVAVVTSDELEKFRLWRFLEQILERGRSFLVCAMGIFFFLVFGGWRLWLWLVVVVVAVVRGDELEILGH